MVAPLLWSDFLMHFPDVEGGIAPLRRLHRSLMMHRRARNTDDYSYEAGSRTRHREAGSNVQALVDRDNGS
jgi:hypothetical protein